MRPFAVALLSAVMLTAGMSSRVVAAEIIVTSVQPFSGLGDVGDGVCTLDEAVLSANTNGAVGSLDCAPGQIGADVVVLGPGTYALLPSDLARVDGLGALRESLQIAGAGAGATLILAAGRASTPVAVDPSAADIEVALTALTLAGDSRQEGFRGVDLQGSGFTGARRDLIVADSVIRDFDMVNGSGGGILSTVGTVTLLRAAIVHNSADNGGGLFIGSSGSAVVLDSTLSHNVAVRGLGGGLVLNPSAVGTVLNSTVARNEALSVGGVFTASGSVLEMANTTVSENMSTLFTGGVRAFGLTRVANSIVLANVSGDCSGFVLSDDYNLFGLGAGCPVTGAGDREVDPAVTFTEILGPLADNGGPTQTYAPLPGSLAVDSGDPAGCMDPGGVALDADQAGGPRPVDGDGDGLAICDVGSFEFQLARTPADELADLQALVDSLGLRPGTAISLLAKLDNALRKLLAGQTEVAINNLVAFIHAVEAQSGKKIDPADAQALIDAARALIDRLLAGDGQTVSSPRSIPAPGPATLTTPPHRLPGPSSGVPRTSRSHRRSHGRTR
ncbi:MAG: choice-of-anchor Q domain-containing protein [Acidobacteriota bacterium]